MSDKMSKSRSALRIFLTFFWSFVRAKTSKCQKKQFFFGIDNFINPLECQVFPLFWISRFFGKKNNIINFFEEKNFLLIVEFFSFCRSKRRAYCFFLIFWGKKSLGFLEKNDFIESEKFLLYYSTYFVDIFMSLLWHITKDFFHLCTFPLAHRVEGRKMDRGSNMDL